MVEIFSIAREHFDSCNMQATLTEIYSWGKRMKNKGIVLD